MTGDINIQEAGNGIMGRQVTEDKRQLMGHKISGKVRQREVLGGQARCGIYRSWVCIGQSVSVVPRDVSILQ